MDDSFSLRSVSAPGSECASSPELRRPRLIHRAAFYGVDVSDGAAVVVDIGGGSIELTRGTAAQVQVTQSAKIGVIRLTEQFVRSDPLSTRDERRLIKCIQNETAETVEQIVGLGFDRVIGTSGTILSLGQLAASEHAACGGDRWPEKPADQCQAVPSRPPGTPVFAA